MIPYIFFLLLDQFPPRQRQQRLNSQLARQARGKSGKKGKRRVKKGNGRRQEGASERPVEVDLQKRQTCEGVVSYDLNINDPE